MKYEPKPSEILSTVDISSGILNRPTRLRVYFNCSFWNEEWRGVKAPLFLISMPPTTQHAGKKKKINKYVYIYINILNKVSRQVKDGWNQNRKNIRKHLTAIRTTSKNAAASKEKTLFGLWALDGEYDWSKLEKRRICSAMALITILLRLFNS